MTDVRLERHDSLYVLTMSDQDKGPRFNAKFMEDVHEILDEVEADKADSALIINSDHPTVWNMGLDLEWIVKQPENYYEQFGSLMDRFFMRLALLNIPTVGCLIGHTMGAGAIMAACLDFRHMREDRGWMKFPAVDVKLTFTPIMHEVVELLPNRRAVNDMLLTARNVSGKEAFGMQIVDAIFPKEILLDKAMEMARFLAKKDRQTYTSVKRGLRRNLAHLSK